MLLTSARELGSYVRDRRHSLGWSQDDLAAHARVSRRWVVDLEAGKSTARIALVFRALDALGIVLDAKPEEGHGVDLDEHLRRFVDPGQAE